MPLTHMYHTYTCVFGGDAIHAHISIHVCFGEGGGASAVYEYRCIHVSSDKSRAQQDVSYVYIMKRMKERPSADHRFCSTRGLVHEHALGARLNVFILTLLFTQTFRVLYLFGINVDPREVDVVRDMARKGPVVLLPTHKSHLGMCRGSDCRKTPFLSGEYTFVFQGNILKSHLGMCSGGFGNSFVFQGNILKQWGTFGISFVFQENLQ